MNDIKRDERWENVYARVVTDTWPDYPKGSDTEILRFEIQVEIGGQILTDTRFLTKEEMDWLAGYPKINAFARQLDMMVEQVDSELLRQTNLAVFDSELRKANWLIQRNRHRSIPPFDWFGPKSDPGRDGCLCAGCEIANSVGGNGW